MNRYVHPLKVFATFSFFLISQYCIGQIPSSLSLSPYAGTERIQFNPALGIHSPYSWDATLIGGHIFSHFDYAFIRKASLLTLGNALREGVVITAESEIPEVSNVPLTIFDQDFGKSKEAFMRGRIIGPAFTFDLANGMRIGAFSNFRFHGASPSIPQNFGIYELNNSYSAGFIDIDKGLASFASWLEIGGHVSKEIQNLSVGINIKYVSAHEGGFIESNTDDNYGFIDSVIITSPIVDFEMAYTTSSINANTLELEFNGSGVGVDLGAQFELPLLTVGAAIKDIGFLQFKNNVEIYSQELLSTITTVRTQDFRDFNTLREFLDQIQNDLNLTPDQSGSFTIGLPTRISLYGDYQYDESFSISGIINQRLPFFPHSLKSNNTLVITPRYDSRWVSYFFPVTVYEYKSLRLGAAVRFGPFTIGTDHLTSVFIPTDFRGSDFFFSLQIFPFSQEENSARKKSRKKLVCP